MKNKKHDNIGQEQNTQSMMLNNEEYNIHAWHEIVIHKSSLYMGSGSRYMPIFYEYYNY